MAKEERRHERQQSWALSEKRETKEIRPGEEAERDTERWRRGAER